MGLVKRIVNTVVFRKGNFFLVSMCFYDATWQYQSLNCIITYLFNHLITLPLRWYGVMGRGPHYVADTPRILDRFPLLRVTRFVDPYLDHLILYLGWGGGGSLHFLHHT